MSRWEGISRATWWVVARPRRRATAVASRGHISGSELPRVCPGLKAWRGLKSVGVVISETQREGKTTDEVRYYISSLPVEAGRRRRSPRRTQALGRGKQLPLEPGHDVP